MPHEPAIRILNQPDPATTSATAATAATNLHALDQRIEAEALSHARQALGQDRLPMKVDLDVSRRNA